MLRRNDDRDKWLHAQCCKGIVYRAIAVELRNNKKGWSIISDHNGIKRAASRWAERNGKPPIPKRQSGRKAKQYVK